MYFPVSGVEIPAPYLLGLGFSVGVCGGFWGVGGGWIVTPSLYALGLPLNLAVGTDLLHIVGKSIVSTFRHFRFGNVSLKIAALMLPGTIVGTEIGASLIEYLEESGARELNSVVTAVYAGILGLLGIFTLYESLRSRKGDEDDQQDLGRADKFEDRVSYDVAGWIQSIRIPPMVKCRRANIEEISVWTVMALGLLTGVLAGLLGVGGGFIRMPALVYLVGLPTHVAVGTDLFEIIISGAYGGLSHAFKGNADVQIALMMVVGASVGAQVGTFATRYTKGHDIRVLLGIAMLIAVAAMILKTYFGLETVSLVLTFGAAAGLTLVIIGVLVRGVGRSRKRS